MHIRLRQRQSIKVIKIRQTFDIWEKLRGSYFLNLSWNSTTVFSLLFKIECWLRAELLLHQMFYSIKASQNEVKQKKQICSWNTCGSLSCIEISVTFNTLLRIQFGQKHAAEMMDNVSDPIWQICGWTSEREKERKKRYWKPPPWIISWFQTAASSL